MQLKTFTFFFKLMTSTCLSLFFTITTYAATIYVGPGGNNSNSGLSSSSPFLTVQHAIEYVASNGGPTSNEVILLDGIWSGVDIDEVPACDSWTSNLLIQGENLDVQVNITNHCKRLTFKGFKTKTMKMLRPADYCRLENIEGVGKSWWEITASHITYVHCKATDSFESGDLIRIAAEGNNPDKVPTDILIESCCFRGADEGGHIDAIQTLGVSGLTIRNSKIYHAPTGLIIPTSTNGVPIENITLENCWFGGGKLYTGNCNWTVTNCVFDAVILYSSKKPSTWTGNKISYLDLGVGDGSDDVFTNNTIRKVGYENGKKIQIPSGNTVDPDLHFTEPSCAADNPITDTEAPEAPGGLTANTVTTHSISFSWDASTDNVGVEYYKVYVDGRYNQIVSGTSATLNGLPPSTQYSFTVIAFDKAANESMGSASLQVTTNDIVVSELIAKSSSDVTSGGSPLAVNYNGDATGGLVSGGGFFESGGELVIEAENFTRIENNGDATNWKISTSLSDYAGSGYITTPNEGISNADWNNACEVQYDIDVSTAGTYNIWLLRNSPNDGANSAFVGIDGVQHSDYDNIDEMNDWYWAHLGSVSISAGNQTFSIRRREDGYNVDKIILTTSSNSPSGNSQVESAAKSAYTYNWDFGDGNNSTEQNPSHTYTKTGTFYTILTVGDGTNTDKDSITITITDTEAPSIPANLTASTITGTTIDLSWDESTENGVVAGYIVYTNGANPVSVTGTSTTINGLSQATEYSFTVSAIDEAANESAQSSATIATTLDTEAPSIPTDLATASVTANSIELNWSAATDNSIDIVYKVYTNGTDPVNVPGTSTIISGLSECADYSFSVGAIDQAGNESEQSTAIQAKTTCTDAAIYSVEDGNNKGLGFTMYPNPNHGDILYMSILSIDSDVLLQINDITGKLIFNRILNSVENSIDISTFKSGIYIISVTNENLSLRKKLIIR